MPWGTPDTTGTSLDNLPSTPTACFPSRQITPSYTFWKAFGLIYYMFRRVQICCQYVSSCLQTGYVGLHKGFETTSNRAKLLLKIEFIFVKLFQDKAMDKIYVS